MAADLYQLLQSLKHSLNPHKIQELKDLLSAQKINKIKLWQLKPIYRTLFTLFKSQMYLILLFACVVVPAKAYERYVEHPDSLPSIAWKMGLLGVVSLVPILYFRRVSRRQLMEMCYNVQMNKIELTLGNKRTIVCGLEEIDYGENMKSILVKEKEFTIEGSGSWNSKELFLHLVRSGSL